RSGTYRIAVDETSHTLAGEEVITLDRPAQVIISPQSATARTLGLVFVTGGPALIVGGVIAAGYGCAPSECGSETTYCRQSVGLALLGLNLAVAGVALTVLGAIMLGRGHRPELILNPSKSEFRAATMFGFAPLRGGAAPMATLTF